MRGKEEILKRIASNNLFMHSSSFLSDLPEQPQGTIGTALGWSTDFLGPTWRVTQNLRTGRIMDHLVVAVAVGSSPDL